MYIKYKSEERPKGLQAGVSRGMGDIYKRRS